MRLCQFYPAKRNREGHMTRRPRTSFCGSFLLATAAVLVDQREVEEETVADDEADGRVDDLPHVYILHANLACNRV